MTDFNPSRWREAQTLFSELVDLPDATQKERLAVISASDPELRLAVERLLRADGEADERLARVERLFGNGATANASPSSGTTDPLGLTGRTISHFRVLSPIAVGGMGIVYHAEDTRLGRAVALKLPLPGRWFARDARDRFLREARAAGALDHANVCAIHEVGEADGHLYIAMPLYSGETLAARIARTGTLPVAEAVAIARAIARGLSGAHVAGVIHRDVKPANVMLLPDGGVKVLDFGLAKPDDLSLSTGHAMAGTVAYMAPEQLRGASIDARADLWALGVVLYEMLTGRRPFVGQTDIAVAHSILHDEPPVARDVRPGIPIAIESVLGTLLEKERDQRPPTAERVEADLAAAEGRLVPPIHSRRGIPRRISARQAAGIAAVGLLVIAGVVAGATRWGRQASGQPGHRATVTQSGTPATKSADTGTSAIVATETDSAHTNDSLHTTQPARSPDEEFVIVADFETAPADSQIADVLTDITRRGLADSRALRALPEDRVNVALQRLQLPTVSRLTVPLARQLALGDGIRAVVAGSLRSFGGRYVLSLRLLSAKSGGKLATVAQTGVELDRLPVALAQLTRELREQAGGDLETLRSQPSLTAITSTSLQAMIDYTTAIRLPRDSALRAAELLNHAIALDSSFGSAYWRLAYHWSFANRRRPTDSTMQWLLSKAWEHRQGLTEYEQLRVELAYKDSPNGIAPSLENHREHLRRIVERYPNAGDAVILGGMYVNARELATAERMYRRAMALDPTYPGGFTGLVNTLILERRYPEARSVLDTATRRFRGVFNSEGLDAAIWYGQGRTDSVRAIMTRLAASTGENRVFANEQLANLELLEGRVGTWRELMRANDSIAGTVMPGFALPRARMLAAYWVLQRPDVSLRILDSAIAEHPSMRTALETTEFYALFGRPDSARAILKARGVPPRSTTYNKGTDTIAAYGAIDLAEARPREAADKYRAVVSTTGGDAAAQTSRDAEIGLALERAGMTDPAIARYEHFLNGPPRLEYDAFKLVWVLEHVAALYEQKGDRKKARTAYERIAEQWKSADQELQPRVVHARERAVALR